MMRSIPLRLLAAVLTVALLLSGCHMWAEFAASNGKEKTDPSQKAEALPFAVQYIRTDGYREDAKFPAVAVIDSSEALDRYYQNNRALYYLERREQVYGDSTVGFLDACDAYDPAFFRDHYLLFVLLQEGSGSSRHRVTGVEKTAEGKISVSVDTLTAEVGTDDMAQWHIILALRRETAVPDARDVLVYWNGKLRYGNGVNMEDQGLAPVRFTKPPEGALIHSSGSAPLMLGGYSWNWQRTEETAESVIVDHAHPLYCKALLTPISATGDYVKLDFPVMPDRISVICWPDTAWNSSDVPSEQVDTFDTGFEVKPGGYIYDITATWEESGALYHGTAHYFVYLTVKEG